MSDKFIGKTFAVLVMIGGWLLADHYHTSESVFGGAMVTAFGLIFYLIVDCESAQNKKPSSHE